MKIKLFKRSILLVLGAFFLAFLLNTGIGSANESKSLLDELAKGNMTYILEHIDSFRMYHTSLGITDVMWVPLLALADMFWAIDTVLYTVGDTLINVLFNPEGMNNLIKSVAKMSQNLFSGLSGALMVTMIAIGAVIAIFFYLSKGRTAAIKQIILILGIMAGSAGWFQVAPTTMTTLNTVSTDIGAQVANSIAGSMSDDDPYKGEVDLVSGNADTAKNASSTVRQSYFEQSYYKLWKLGTLGNSNVKDKDTGNFLKENPLTDKEVDKLAKDETLKSYTKYFDKYSGAYKMVVSFVGIFIVILKAIPYVMIGLFNWVITMLIMVLTLGIPVLALISFIPRYNRSMINGIVKIIGLFMAKAGIVLTIVVVTLADQLVNTMIGSGSPTVGFMGIGMLMVSTILQFVLLYLVWKFRNQILSVVSGGLVTNVPYMDNAMNRMRGIGNTVSGDYKQAEMEAYEQQVEAYKRQMEAEREKENSFDSQDEVKDSDVEAYATDTDTDEPEPDVEPETDNGDDIDSEDVIPEPLDTDVDSEDVNPETIDTDVEPAGLDTEHINTDTDSENLNHEANDTSYKSQVVNPESSVEEPIIVSDNDTPASIEDIPNQALIKNDMSDQPVSQPIESSVTHTKTERTIEIENEEL